MVEKPEHPVSNLAIAGAYYIQSQRKLKHAIEELINNDYKTKNEYQLTDALVDVREIDEQAIQMILAGEKSGKLAEAILHHTKIETEKIELQEDLLAEWIPRLFYLLVVFWVASSII